MVQTTEPRYVSPTRRDRIGRIWAPVLIDGKGPYRMVLDTGANRSAITTRAAHSLGNAPAETSTIVTGFTGTAVVPTLHVNSLEVGDLLIGPSDLPVLTDVFGGAQGVLGIEGLQNKRIYADFTHDRLEITLSHGERAKMGLRRRAVDADPQWSAGRGRACRHCPCQGHHRYGRAGDDRQPGAAPRAHAGSAPQRHA